MTRREAAKRYIAANRTNLNLVLDFALMSQANKDVLLTAFIQQPEFRAGLVEQDAKLDAEKARVASALTEIDEGIK